MDTPVIVLQDLTRHFGATVAVDHLAFQVHRGEIFGLLGHNGAGKTTTVRLLNGVLTPTAGAAQVLGLSPVTQGSELRRHTGVLTETPSLDERLTGRENLAIYAELYDVPRDEVAGRVEELLGVFELADRADDKVGGYSKGMHQRLALARALLHDPQILFLDEPTSGLDPVTTRHVHEMITRLSRTQGHTVLLCTHNLAEAQKLCDRVAVLQQGRLVALGTTAELAQQVGRSRRLEIEVEHAKMPNVVEMLSRIPQVTNVIQQDGVISLQGADREAVADLVAALAASGVRIYRVSPEEPSLEDVYFALTGASKEVVA
jgi:ABC-2 type transport system ATP-binding protein